jgi:hypothetical protein
MIVGETSCDCSKGFRVVAVVSNGVEFSTDAEGTTSADFAAWIERIRERTEHLEFRERLIVRITAKETHLIMRPCRDCRGDGWLFRLHRESANVGAETRA